MMECDKYADPLGEASDHLANQLPTFLLPEYLLESGAEEAVRRSQSS